MGLVPHFGILKSALMGFSPNRGGVLSATSMAVMPKDHTSARTCYHLQLFSVNQGFPIFSHYFTSGAIQYGVPIAVRRLPLGPSTMADIPLHQQSSQGHILINTIFCIYQSL